MKEGKSEKYDRITIRFDRSHGRKIRELAKRRDMSVAEYCRMMCLLEVIIDEPTDEPVFQQLKETLVDLEEFAHLEVEAQMPVLRRAVEAVEQLREATKRTTTWLLAVARAVDAYGRQKGERGDVRSARHEGDPDTPDAR